jgi:exodeoxyribonuclease V gamma subunit
MPIDVVEASRFETLWRQFEQTLDAPLASPLACELVAVPAAGWESYFSRRLAIRRGCWAQYRFISFSGWMNSTFRAVLPNEDYPVRDPDALTWAVASKLPGLLDDDAFTAVRNYLGADTSAIESQRLIDLARRVAGLFDQYLLYRPDLIDAWNRGIDWPETGIAKPSHTPWQRKLWKTIRQTCPTHSVSAMVRDLAQNLSGNDPRLPERVSVWMCGGVPPAHLDFLDVAGRHTHIALYVLSPSNAFGTGQDSQRRLFRQLRESGASLREFCQANHLNPPHPLWESMGELSRQRQMLMAANQDEPWRYHKPKDVPDAQKTLLGSLQRDIRQARAPVPSALQADESLRIHSCHSAIREVEVLREQLRDAFESDPNLQPEDVAVLCPDIETYAPLVHAVFGLSQPGQAGHIPYHIAGRSPRRTRPLVEAYFRLLEILQGRLGASEVLDLLNVAAVGEAADLDAEEIESITAWVTESGIRWGADTRDREAESLPSTDLHTWQFGLDRLLLGYAMPPGGGQLVGDVVALDRVEGLKGDTLGKLWAFFGRLRDWRSRLKDARLLCDWREPLCQLAEEMLATGQDEGGEQRIFEAADRLVKLSQDNGFDALLPFSVVVRELAQQVDQAAGGWAFRLGGMAVCEITALRSLPFKVVALLGLNDGVFPRVDRPVGFDLMAQSPRLGDRSLRFEDKHLFLEALLAAESRLVITYQGQNLQDQRHRPPSVAVEELLDVVEQGSIESDGHAATLREALVVRHPLQAFSPNYFDGRDARLFSYENSHLLAAQAILGEKEDLPVFAPDPLPEEEKLQQLRVSDLRKVLESPWELFLRRLGVYLPDSAEASDDREPLLLNALEKWQLGDQWLEQRLAGEPEDRLGPRLSRSGQLPGGSLGQATLGKVKRQAEAVLQEAQELGLAATEVCLPIRLEVDGTLLLGRVEGFTPSGLQRATYSNIAMKRVPQLWLDHLLATAMSKRSLGPAVLVGRGAKERTITLAPVTPSKALSELCKLVRLYRISRCVPLPFFPESVGKVIEIMRKDGLDPDDPVAVQNLLFAAEGQYEYQFIGTAAADLPSVRAAFAGRTPFGMKCSEVPGLEHEGDCAVFVYLVRTICGPIVQNLLQAEALEIDAGE